MKILLDECVFERLAHDFAGHDVLTVRRPPRCPRIIEAAESALAAEVPCALRE